MRYTTIIDVSQFRDLYRNKNLRLIYLHLVLKSGYHDTDRDLIVISIRVLAAEVGLSVSAARHAISKLMEAKLIQKDGEAFRVLKWVQEDTITPREHNKRQTRTERAKAQARREEQAKMDAQLAQQEKERAAAAARGKTSFQIYVETLQKKASAGDAEAALQLSKVLKRSSQ